jgi:hypothetical protein
VIGVKEVDVKRVIGTPHKCLGPFVLLTARDQGSRISAGQIEASSSKYEEETGAGFGKERSRESKVLLLDSARVSEVVAAVLRQDFVL